MAELPHLINVVSECKSRSEEIATMKNEVSLLDKQFQQPLTSKTNKRDMFLRAVFCELMGHQVPRAWVPAINLTQSTKVADKSVGYMAVSLFLDPENEKTLLLTSCYLRDMESTNIAIVMHAITSLTFLVTDENAEMFFQKAAGLMDHESPMIRKKAVLLFNRCLILKPSLRTDKAARVIINKALCDRDPSVMAVTLPAITGMTASDTGIANSLITILVQVVEGALPSTFVYHDYNAPWIQVQLIRLLADCPQVVNNHISLFLKIVKAALNSKASVSFAVLYEALRVLSQTGTYRPEILDMILEGVSAFFASPTANLRYLGLKLLVTLVVQHPEAAINYQESILEFLDGEDESLRRLSLDLLYFITTPDNISSVATRLLRTAHSTLDSSYAETLVQKLTALGEKYSPSPKWFLSVTLKALSAECLSDRAIEELTLSFSAFIEEYIHDEEFKQHAMQDMVKILDENIAPVSVIKVAFWSVSRHAPELLPESYRTENGCPPDLRQWAAALSLVRPISLPEAFSKSSNPDIQQYAAEAKVLRETNTQVSDLAVEDPDPFLGHLDSFVQAAKMTRS